MAGVACSSTGVVEERPLFHYFLLFPLPSLRGELGEPMMILRSQSLASKQEPRSEGDGDMRGTGSVGNHIMHETCLWMKMKELHDPYLNSMRV